MPLDAFKQRWPENVPGKFYVSNQCLDCDLCRQVAPENFARNDDGGYSYLKKQPQTPEEEAVCREALKGCCTETIFDDGLLFDWNQIPAAVPWHLTPEGKAQQAQRKAQTQSDCCRKKEKSDETSS